MNLLRRQILKSMWSNSLWIFKSKRMNLLSHEKYKKTVKMLLNFNKMIGIKPSYMYRWKKQYHIFSNQESSCMYQRVAGKGNGGFKCALTYEKIFDIINCAHKQLGHAKCHRKNKNNIQSLLYSVQMSAVLLYLQTCMACASSKKIVKKKKYPLKFIISQQVGT
jgi:hypothetical protein